MASEFDRRLRAVDHALLAPPVRAALQNQNLTINNWTCQRLHGIGGEVIGGVFGIYRFRGEAQAGDERLPWSLVLKAFGGASGSGSQDTRQWNYWKREVLAYQSGILDSLPAGLSAPRCYGVTEYPGAEYWVWLEDLGQEAQPAWSMERYGLAARRLGRFNGAYLTGHPVPSEPWFSRGRVRDWMAASAELMADLAGLAEEPIVRTWLGSDGLERMLQLWSQRESLLEALDRLPRCLCHHDAFPRNLMWRGHDDGSQEMVGIDWSMVGPGAIGEEIAPFVGVSLQFLDVPMADAQELDRVAFEGYVAGLRDAGWRGDSRLVRFGYTAALALFLGIGCLWEVQEYWLNAAWRRWLEQEHRRPFDEILHELAMLQRFLLDRGEEALELRADLR